MFCVRVILVSQALQAHLDLRVHQDHQDSLAKEGKQASREIQDLQERWLVWTIDRSQCGDLEGFLIFGRTFSKSVRNPGCAKTHFQENFTALEIQMPVNNIVSRE